MAGDSWLLKVILRGDNVGLVFHRYLGSGRHFATEVLNPGFPRGGWWVKKISLDFVGREGGPLEYFCKICLSKDELGCWCHIQGVIGATWSLPASKDTKNSSNHILTLLWHGMGWGDGGKGINNGTDELPGLSTSLLGGRVARVWSLSHFGLMPIWIGIWLVFQHPSISVRTTKQSKCQSNGKSRLAFTKMPVQHLGSGRHFATEILDPDSPSIKCLDSRDLCLLATKIYYV